jgi:hypothetical protein
MLLLTQGSRVMRFKVCTGVMKCEPIRALLGVVFITPVID